MHMPFTLEEFTEIYSRVPRLNVEVIIVDSAGIVLSKRSMHPHEGLWHIPGGTVYMDEGLEAAVQRVARDELGVTVTVGEMIGYIEYPELRRNGYFGWPIGIAFMAEITDGTLRGSDQGEEVKVFTELPDNAIPEQKNFLEKHVPPFNS